MLGASGTIGQNAIDIIRRFSDRFELAGVSVHTKTDVLDAFRAEFHFQDFVVTDSAAAANYDTKHQSLERFLMETPADIVVNGIAGAA